MKRLAMALVNPTPDLGGACSLMLELGGLVVIHDAAGCIENYVCFDEPRWYGSDSMLYTSGLSHMDAVLGNEERLAGQLVRAAQKLHPKFIAIVGSPVPFTLGMDLEGLAMEVERQCGIPSFGLECGSFSRYGQGASDALYCLMDRFTLPPQEKEKSVFAVNLLGATPLDFTDRQIAEIRQKLQEDGVAVKSALCMGASLEDIVSAANADANLVVSYGGLQAACLMKERFSIPWTWGLPVAERQTEALCRRLKGKPSAKSGDAPAGARCLVLGEQVFAASMAEALCLNGIAAAAGVTMDFSPAIGGAVPSLRLPDEESVRTALQEDWKIVIGDPLYRALMPQNTEAQFLARPHTALSSHLYTKDEIGLQELFDLVRRYVK